MRHARRRVVRRVTRLAAVGGLLLGGTMVTRAMASETPGSSALTRTYAQEAAGTGGDLVAQLGSSRTAGTWIGADGKPVVAVTDESAAAEVRRAGAEAKVVQHSMNELKSATTQQILQIRASASALRQLREGLWASDPTADPPA